MSVVAAQLIGTVEIIGADESIALLEAVGAACDALKVRHATVGNGDGEARAASRGGADEALVGLQGTADATAASLVTLGDNAGGLSALAAQASEAEASLTGLTEVMAALSTVVAESAGSATTLAESLGQIAGAAGDTDGALTSVDTSASVLADILAAIQAQTDVLSTGFATLAVFADDAAVSLGNIDATLAGMDGALVTTTVEADSAGVALGFLSGAADAAAVGVEALVSVLEVVATALAVVGVVAGVAGVVSAKMAGDFESEVTRLYTTAGELHKNLKMVGDGILTMASQVGTGAMQLVQGMYWIESGGAHGAAGLNDLRIAAEAAKAENSNLNDVARALMGTLNAYRGTGLSAAQAMNILVALTT